MITVKAFNVIHQGRKNQNTTFWFSERKLYFLLGALYQDETVTEDFLLRNFDIIKPKDVKMQKNTSLKILK